MNWINCIVRAERAIMVACSLFLATIICLVVFMRYLFQIDLFAYEEPVLLIAFILYFVGAAYATHVDEHIKADLVSAWIKSPLGRHRYQCVLHVVSALVSLILAVLALRMMIGELSTYPRIPRTTVYHIPFALPRAFIFIGFSLMTLHSVIHVIHGCRLWKLGAPDTPSAEQPGSAAS